MATTQSGSKATAKKATAKKATAKKATTKRATTTKTPTTKKKATTKAKATATATAKKATATKATPARGVITPEARRFIGELGRRQDKAWFEPRKDELKRLLQEPVLAVLREAGAGLLDAFPAVEDAAPKVFRIYRDVRFSKDKSPYKDHVGGTLVVGQSVLYLHVGGDEVFAAVGVYDPSPVQLLAFRTAVAATDVGPSLLRETEALEARGYGLMSIDALARAPAGFLPTHPCIRLLRLKGWALKLPPLPASSLDDGSLGAVIARGVLGAKKAIALAERAFVHRPS